MKLLGGKRLPLPMGHPHHVVLRAYPHPRSQNSLGFAEGWLKTRLSSRGTPSTAVKAAAGFSPARFTTSSRSRTQLGLA